MRRGIALRHGGYPKRQDVDAPIRNAGRAKRDVGGGAAVPRFRPRPGARLDHGNHLVGDFLIDVGAIVGDPCHDFFLSFEAESRSQQQPALPFRRGTGWGGRARIWPQARASRLSAADARRASGAALGGLHGGPDCRSGTKGQPPLVFPLRRRASGRGPRRERVYAAPLACRRVCHVAHLCVSLWRDHQRLWHRSRLGRSTIIRAE